MPVLDATPGGTAANSYTDRASADAYFDGRLFADAWTGQPTAQRDLALIAATARLEQEGYVGRVASTTQALRWPRVGAVDEDGMSIDATTVPRAVQRACAELALYLLGSSTDPLAMSGLEAFRSIAIAGAIDFTLRDDRPNAGDLPPQVARLLRGLRTTGGQTRLVRG